MMNQVIRGELVKARSVLQGVLISFLTYAVAGTTLASECSEQFVGTVLEVNTNSPFTYSKEVTFQVDHSLEGHYSPTRSLNLNDAQFDFEKGASYLLGLDGEELCEVEFLARR